MTGVQTCALPISSLVVEQFRSEEQCMQQSIKATERAEVQVRSRHSTQLDKQQVEARSLEGKDVGPLSS